MNPNGQVPVLVVDGSPLTQIVAMCDFIDRAFPEAGLLPQGGWERIQALSQLAWMNSSPHPTATRFFFPDRYAQSDAARAEVKKRAAEEFRGYLERIEKLVPASGYWLGERLSFHDAYALTLLRWGGFAGIDPRSLAGYHAYAERVLGSPPVAAAAARERIALDTYKG